MNQDQERTIEAIICELLNDNKEHSTKEIKEYVSHRRRSVNPTSISNALKSMTKNGRLVKVSHAIYRMNLNITHEDTINYNSILGPYKKQLSYISKYAHQHLQTASYEMPVDILLFNKNMHDLAQHIDSALTILEALENNSDPILLLLNAPSSNIDYNDELPNESSDSENNPILNDSPDLENDPILDDYSDPENDALLDDSLGL